LKRILLKTAWLYKYSCAILLFVVTILSYVNHFTIYDLYYEYLSHLIGFSVLFCYRELYVCYYGFKEKCIWQKAVTWGLMSNCIINLILMNYSDETYVSVIKMVGLTVFTLVALFYLYIEELMKKGYYISFVGILLLLNAILMLFVENIKDYIKRIVNFKLF
jgi:hypothetical protein